MLRTSRAHFIPKCHSQSPFTRTVLNKLQGMFINDVSKKGHFRVYKLKIGRTMTLSSLTIHSSNISGSS
uniref:Uncharacterized protein n=1 Tax=Mus musculus TaxID=10090 RepID=Q3TYS5_MOUSE|nr:unnamed protein product [Mus musculus]BAE34487.1 unnamed protein product [Mus musculus]